MKLEFEPKFIEVEYRKTNGQVETKRTEIGFILQDSIFQAMFSQLNSKK